ncbi:MAG: hypothetical protein IJP66_03890 [Kiritimatiellae bacterium]|nr:hypothetical protein [Kiritimatiellia bacterium]
MNVQLDMHNKITATQLHRMVRLQLDTLAKRPVLAAVLPPLMVWGAPGLGKSTILRDAAREAGIGFIDVRLAQREPVDIRGLPVPGPDGVKWLVSSDWPRDPQSRGIILFDEITAADRSLQVAAYEFILDRRLGELYRVPDGWYICAAGNRTGDRAVATTMSSALANRFLHVELGEDAESWAAWALRHAILPSVVGFIRFRPGLLFNQEGENLERGWPTPRAWERVSRMLEVMAAEDEELVRHMVYGLVGNRAGVEFMEFRKMSATMDDVLAMMRDPSAEIKIPQKADMKYALCSAAAYHVWRGEDAQDAARRLDGFYRLCIALSSDFASMLMMDAMTGTGLISDEEACNRLFAHKSYKEWSEKHGKALNKRYAL